MIKVIHVSGAKVWGGNEQQLLDLLKNLKHEKIKHYLYTVKSSKLIGFLDSNLCEIILSKKDKLKSQKNCKHFYDELQKIKPHIIHLHTSDALNLTYYTSLFYKINPKIIFEKKGMGSSSSLFSKIKYNSKIIDRIICVSDFVAEKFSEQLSHKNRSKNIVINDAIDISLMNEHKLRHVPFDYKNYFIVGNIANHTSAKNLDLFIDIADIIINSLNIKDIKFIQVGRFSKLTAELKFKIDELKLNEFFTFEGEFENAFLLNQYFDVFLLTSEREGGPTSILEAFFMKTPVVTTSVGITQELIEDSVNGYIVENMDPNEIVIRLLEIYKFPEKLKKKLDSNKKLIEDNYSSKIKAKKVLDLYNSLK
ncbi:glycosyltransferase family 4 protein [Psychroflexus tropicus]|uniref:glycosyltransferase family 4 protein n=1 Tax=Psychroflexus tropicus TaxID=197345 RepID=UPI000370BCAB|nr:glycosyltransferase family 4 protein [Psychroflexus tropicus]